uniref:Uncharacterized protein n=1 Tax=Rhizophora mucronata TaxID=61149 RepID=A0A2P2Q9S3_RHIMU
MLFDAYKMVSWVPRYSIFTYFMKEYLKSTVLYPTVR